MDHTAAITQNFKQKADQLTHNDSLPMRSAMSTTGEILDLQICATSADRWTS
ncbi:MAG: hypothetical protein IV093_16940 [Rubrivivax sp.]|nr:hypothetical protein [Rubrivivax sp.]